MSLDKIQQKLLMDQVDSILERDELRKRIKEYMDRKMEEFRNANKNY